MTRVVAKAAHPHQRGLTPRTDCFPRSLHADRGSYLSMKTWLPPAFFRASGEKIASRTSRHIIGALPRTSAPMTRYALSAQLPNGTEKRSHCGPPGIIIRHFYNWYDTHSLQALPPRYVSTIDSGNFAGHLLVLRSGLLELLDTKILPPRVFDGVQDTAWVLFDAIRGFIETMEPSLDPFPAKEALRKIDRLVAELRDPPSNLSTSFLLLQRSADWASDLAQVSGLDAESQTWARALERCVVEHRNDVAHLAPWALLPPMPENLRQRGSPGPVNRLDALRKALEQLDDVPTLRQVAALKHALLPLLDGLRAECRGPDSGGAASPEDSQVDAWLSSLRCALVNASHHALERIRLLEDAASRCREFSNMDFSFLFDNSRDLLSIGYNVGEHRLDKGYYDLLASEARLASFYAISQGQLTQEHWFALGRLLTTSRGAPALLSWSGSMFEYLMPLLVMPTYENTLLDQTYKAVVRRQIRLWEARGVPWGISESGSTHGMCTWTTSIGPLAYRGLD